MAGGALANSPETLTLNKGETRTIWVENILRLVNTGPGIFSVKQDSAKEISIYGLGPGEAYLHVWDYNKQRISFRIKVIGAKAEVPRTGRGLDISGHYSVYYKRDRDADYPVNQEMHTQELLLNLPTFFGRNTTLVRYQQQLIATNNTEGQIAQFTTSFRGNRYNFLLGDDILAYSEIMAPGLTYQGARLQLYSLFNTLDLDVFAGDMGNMHWGRKIRDDICPTRNVSGGRFNWQMLPQLSWQGTYLMSYDANLPVTNNRLVGGALGLKYSWDKYLSFTAEDAGSQRDKDRATAVYFNSLWENEQLRLDCTIRDIMPEYETVSNWLQHSGEKGVYLRSSYRPSQYWSLWGAFDGYLRRFPESVLNEDYQLNRNKLTFAWHKLPFVAPSVMFWRNYGNVNVWEGLSLRLSQISFWAPLLTFYYEFTPSSYQNSSFEDSSYKQQRGIFGTAIKLAALWDLRLERQWEFYEFRSGNTDDPNGGNVILSCGTFDLPWTRIKTVMTWRYQYRQNRELDTDQSLYSGSIQLRDNIMQGLSWYLRLIGVAQHIKNFDLEEMKYVYDDDKVRSEVSGGVVYVF